MKPKLLLHPDKWSNAKAHFLESLYSDYFELVLIDPTATYRPRECIVYSHCLDTNWTITWRDSGFVVVIDNLWEETQKNLPSDVYTIRPDRWFFRANESLWYTALGYNQYRRNPVITKTFLMLMNIRRDHRDQIWKQIDLTDSIYSYHGRSVKLNYADKDTADADWQRAFNPDWYDLTNFSMVVESTVVPEELWHSEKTWKPIAFYHPFILWGPAGYVQDLRDQGFASFDHVVDESYDKELDHSKRLAMIIDQVRNLKTIQLTDSETVKRTTHNHNLFFDIEWSQNQFRQHLFYPMLDLL
jgi:hypothetical protein